MNWEHLCCGLAVAAALTGCAVWAPAPAASPSPTAPELETVTARQLKILESLPLGIIGGTEWVYIENVRTSLAAKIDTGADSCSISATKLRFFERDGKKWVSFNLPVPGSTGVRLERPLKRQSRVKRHGAESLERPVVSLKIRIGEQVVKRDFSLTDRTKFKFPVLIGQNLLKGLAAVDVSRNFTLGK